MAAHVRLKNEFTEDKKYHTLMRWLIYFGRRADCNANCKLKYWDLFDAFLYRGAGAGEGDVGGELTAFLSVTLQPQGNLYNFHFRWLLSDLT